MNVDDCPRDERQQDDLSEKTNEDGLRAFGYQFEVRRFESQTQVKHQQRQYGQYNKNSVHNVSKSVVFIPFSTEGAEAWFIIYKRAQVLQTFHIAFAVEP